MTAKSQRRPASQYTIQQGMEEANMTCPEFFKLLGEHRPMSIDATVKMVADYKPEYLKRRAFSYSSESMHESSFENPRAIIYGGDARMIMTFNGDKKHDGYERLEIACFDDKTRKFKFRDIAFPGDAVDESVLEDIPVHRRKSAFVISPVNGHKNSKRDCRTCHGFPARPNYEPYFIWPGTCGSEDDYTAGYTGRLFKDSTDITKNEKAKCDAFIENMQHKERYRHLPPVKTEPRYGGNLGLHMALTELNTLRILGELKALGDRFSDRKQLFGEALACAHIKGDHSIRESSTATQAMLLDTYYANWEANVQILNKITEDLGEENISFPTLANEYYVDAQEAAKKHLNIQIPADPLKKAAMSLVMLNEVNMIAEFRQILEPLGVDVHNWSMTHRTEGYLFNDGSVFRGFTSFKWRFFEEFFPDDPEVMSIIRSIKSSNEMLDSKYQKLCDLLVKRRSEQEKVAPKKKASSGYIPSRLESEQNTAEK